MSSPNHKTPTDAPEPTLSREEASPRSADALYSAALTSGLRTIAGAKPELKLDVFGNVSRELGGYVLTGGLDRQVVVDRLHDAATAHGLYDEHGVDAVQAVLAAAFSVNATVADVATVADNGPLPLFPPMPQAEPYPTMGLGGVLSGASLAIASKVQVPVEIAAQSVLAAAALVAQTYADVRMPYGQSRPCSLFFGTVAATGDRKTSTDNEALRPIRLREKAMKERNECERGQYAIDKAAWTGEKRKIEADKKLNYEERKLKLAALGAEPPTPLSPFLVTPDPTVEGLIMAWVSAPPALGLFTAEGGQFIGGFGMTHEHRLKTAANFSMMWDGHEIKRLRAGDGLTILNGRRLSAHLMVQPDAAAQFFADPILRDQGLLSRVLVAAPETLAGTRTYQTTKPEDEAAIDAYSAHLLSISERPWPLADGTRNELVPGILSLSPSAVLVWREFYNEIETRSAPSADLHPIRDFAAKAAEHAARIGAVITTITDFGATEITDEVMVGAVTLARWYVGEALRLQSSSRTDPRLLRAHQLLQWMRDRPEPDGIDFRDILRMGPGPLRTKAKADEAVAILFEHGWIKEVSARPRRLGVIRGDGE